MTKEKRDALLQALAAGNPRLEILKVRRIANNILVKEWKEREKLGLPHPRPRRSNYVG